MDAILMATNAVAWYLIIGMVLFFYIMLGIGLVIRSIGALITQASPQKRAVAVILLLFFLPVTVVVAIGLGIIALCAWLED